LLKHLPDRTKCKNSDFIWIILPHTNTSFISLYPHKASPPQADIKEEGAILNTGIKITKDTTIEEKTKIVRAAISSLAETLQIDLKLRK
jgi:hypothetical protein